MNKWKPSNPSLPKCINVKLLKTIFLELRDSMQQTSHSEAETSSVPKPDSKDPMAPRSDQKEDVDESEGRKPDPETDFSESASAESFQEDDAEAAELARLRCESVRTEEKKQPGKNNKNKKDVKIWNSKKQQLLQRRKENYDKSF